LNIKISRLSPRDKIILSETLQKVILKDIQFKPTGIQINFDKLPENDIA